MQNTDKISLFNFSDPGMPKMVNCSIHSTLACNITKSISSVLFKGALIILMIITLLRGILSPFLSLQ